MSNAWQAITDPNTNRKYYYNRETKCTSWVPPEGFKNAEVQWQEIFSQKHKRPYWANLLTGTTTWEEPLEVRQTKLSNAQKVIIPPIDFLLPSSPSARKLIDSKNIGGLKRIGVKICLLQNLLNCDGDIFLARVIYGKQAYQTDKVKCYDGTDIVNFDDSKCDANFINADRYTANWNDAEYFKDDKFFKDPEYFFNIKSRNSENNNIVITFIKDSEQSSKNNTFGTAIIDLNSAKAGLQWYDVKNENEIVAHAVIGCNYIIPIPESILEIEKRPEKGKFSIKKRKEKKRCKENVQVIEQFMHFILQNSYDYDKSNRKKKSNSMGASSHSTTGEESGRRASLTSRSKASQPFDSTQFVIKIYPLLKERENLVYLAQSLLKTAYNSNKCLSFGPAWDALKDVLSVAARAHHNDFATCKMLYHICFLYYRTNEKNNSQKFMFSDIKSHEVFKNPLFWDHVAKSMERELQHDPNHLAIMDEQKSINQPDSGETSPVGIDLFWIIALSQFSCGMSWPDISSSTKNMCEERRIKHDILEKLIEEQKNIAQILDPTANYNTSLSIAKVNSISSKRQPSRTGRKGLGSYQSSSSNHQISLGNLYVTRKPKMISTEEYIIRNIDNVTHRSTHPCIPGSVFLTNYRIVFMAKDNDINEDPQNEVFLQIPLGCLNKYETKFGRIVLDCRDLREIIFEWSKETKEKDIKSFIKDLKRAAFPGNIKKVFAFSYRIALIGNKNGWYLYDSKKDFDRMGFNSDVMKNWGLKSINAGYRFCASYPISFVVPAAWGDTELAAVKSFRSKGRIPIMVYCHMPNGPAECKEQPPIIFRSAQPRTGMTNRKCKEDVDLLRLAGIRVIIDLRPKINAVACSAKGFGYEQTNEYDNCTLEWRDVGNIHVMRASLQQVIQLVNQAHLYSTTSNSGDKNASSYDYYHHLAQSNWLKHVRLVLLSAMECAMYISGHDGRPAHSVLVHCSDGWDRTSQCSSLAQMILDPYYRTMEGFAVIIEKEWVAFGHKFTQRCGHASKEWGDSERSPIFLQFLDCSWQILQQYPLSFEFNTKYLDFIANHLYSNLFGTFLHNNDKERQAANVRRNTVSIWTVALQKEEFKNHFYKARKGILLVNCDPRALSLWPYYYRWDPRFLPKESIVDRARGMIYDERRQSEMKIKALQEKIEKLEKLNESGTTCLSEKMEESTTTYIDDLPSTELQKRWERSSTTLGAAIPTTYSDPPPPERDPNQEHGVTEQI